MVTAYQIEHRRSSLEFETLSERFCFGFGDIDEMIGQLDDGTARCNKPRIALLASAASGETAAASLPATRSSS